MTMMSIIAAKALSRCRDIFNDYSEDEVRKESPSIQGAWELGKQAAGTQPSPIPDDEMPYCPKCDAFCGPEAIESGGNCRICHEPLEYPEARRRLRALSTKKPFDKLLEIVGSKTPEQILEEVEQYPVVELKKSTEPTEGTRSVVVGDCCKDKGVGEKLCDKCVAPKPTKPTGKCMRCGQPTDRCVTVGYVCEDCR